MGQGSAKSDSHAAYGHFIFVMEVVWRFLVALIPPYSLSAISGIFFGYFEKS